VQALKKAIALFSGGKDSLLSMIKARQQGYIIKHLLFMVPTLPLPNPHLINYHIVRRIADFIGIPITRVELEKGREQETLAEAIRQYGSIDALIAGDVLLEDHLKWHQEVCELARVELAEPLYGEDTLDLYEELFRYNIEFTIIATSHQLPETLIGTKVHNGNKDYILRVLRAHLSDPIGEYGEYHTLVNYAPLMKTGPLTYHLNYIVDNGEYGAYGIFRQVF
jgi:diphthine-ammonia ligase